MKKNLLLLISASFISAVGFSQSTIELLGAPGTGGPAGVGPVFTGQAVTFHTAAATAYSPVVTATYSITNQQFASIEGNPTSLGVQMGSTITGTANSPVPTANIYDLINVLGGSVNTNYTACNSCGVGTGIDIAANRSIKFTCFADALVNAAGTQLQALNARVHFADITITFNRPVSNPMLHITGLGGQAFYTAAAVNYDMGYSTDFDLLTPGLTLSKISGNAPLTVTATSISNNAARFGAATTAAPIHGISRIAATGTVAVLGTNITTISFRLFLRGDGGIIVNNAGTVIPATNGNIVRWALHGGFIPGGGGPVQESISGDGFLLGLSLQQPVTVSGTVFNDPDGANVNNSSGGANLVPAGLFANLTDNLGNVVFSSGVNTDGTYSFPAIFEGSSYSVKISTTAGVQGSPVPALVLPSGWATTGEFNGTPNTGNDGTANGTSASFAVAVANVINTNFGIERLPESAFNLQANQPNPSGINNFIVPASAFQVNNVGATPNTQDYDIGTVTNIRITAFPANAASITINGTQYTSGSWPALGVTVPYTNGTGPSQAISIDPIDGAVNAVISFAAIDNLGKEDTTPGSVTLPFSTVLPVKLESFTALPQGNNVVVNWAVSEEVNIDLYDVEFSADGANFTSIGTVKPVNNAVRKTYSLTHTGSFTGINYYRLKIKDIDGSVKYSDIRKINFSSQSIISVYPVPAKENINITLTGNIVNKPATIKIINMEGRIVYRKVVAALSQTESIDISKLLPGKYIINIISGNERINRSFEVAK
jgi:Secretion system C-terminal sorting domain